MNVNLGVSASSGIGIGKAFILPEDTKRVIPRQIIADAEKDAEWKRFQDACTQVYNQIHQQLQNMDPANLQKIIFETYELMLTDPVFLQETQDTFYLGKNNIEYVVEQQVTQYAEKLRNSGNDYLAERSQDIEDVYGRVIDVLIDYHPFNINQVPDNVVIVARELKTSDTIILSKRKIAGLALTLGGTNSHVAILAKSFGIPAVVGLENISTLVKQDEVLIVDGLLGEVINSPDESTLTEYNTKIQAELKNQARLKKFKDLPAATADGTIFKLYANIGTVEEAKIALDEGADGIGLFRTEFLFMNKLQGRNNGGPGFSNIVSEDEQFEAYKAVLQMMGDKPVTIRTLDAGGDKLISSCDLPELHEKNPLMGLRAIRLSLYYPRVLRTQLRALYRASVYGNLRIMLPLITGTSQVETVRGIARSVMMDLRSENIPFKEDVPMGIMVETAAGAICSDCLAPISDFFSLGTNDLTQYTIGVDRENPAVAPLYNEFNLAVLRLIKMTIDNAHKQGIPISVCGEMAGKMESVIVLAGMGIRNLSMSPKQISVIKETLSQFTIDELENISRSSLF